jgi:hypothetical protein
MEVRRQWLVDVEESMRRASDVVVEVRRKPPDPQTIGRLRRIRRRWGGPG